jgi:hypothetical protein
MSKFPKFADVVAACFLMMVCLYAGSEIGREQAIKQVEKCK